MLLNKCLVLAAWLIVSYAAAQSGSNQVQNLLLGADQLLEQGDFVGSLNKAFEAEEHLHNSGDPVDTIIAEIYLRIGKCYGVLYERKLATKYLDSAITILGPARPTVYYSLLNQQGLRKNDTLSIGTALAFFKKNKDARQTAECLASLGSLAISQSTAKEPPEFRECLSILQTTGLGKSAMAGRCNMLLGFFYWKGPNQYAQALDYLYEAETIFLQTGGQKSNYLAGLYVNIGGCLDDMGSPRKAIDLYLKAEQNFLRQSKEHPILISCYNNMGRSLGDLSEFSASIQYLEKTIQLAPAVGRYWNNLGDAYLNQGDLENAGSRFRRALNILLKDEKSNRSEIARPLHNLAVIYRLRGALDSALAYELRSLPYRKSDPNALLDIARSYLGAGECYLALGKYQESLLYLDSALWLQGRKLPSRLYAETSDAYAAKARVRAALGDFATAIVLTDSALYASGYRGAGLWGQVSAPPELLSALEQKAALYYSIFEKTGEESKLLKAVQLYDTAAQAVRYFRNTLLDSESKATLAGQFRDILSGGVEAALALHQLRPTGNGYLKLAFAFSEQSKALVLLEGVRSAGVLKFEGVPDSIVARERVLREAVNEAEVVLKKLSYAGISIGNDRLAAAKDTLFDRQRNFERFQQVLASGQYADYFNFRYGFSLVTPEEIQNQLLDNESTMLSYFIGKGNRITAFVITKTQMQAISCEQRVDLERLVAELRQGLFGYYALPVSKRRDEIFEKTTTQFVAAGQALYTQLLAPVEHLLKGTVIIVPDGQLATIPFELLLTAPPKDAFDFGNYPYWFKTHNHTVSYAYSATLLREMTQKQHTKMPEKALFAMAPFFLGTHLDVESKRPIAELSNSPTPGLGKRNFKPLPYSGEELRDICALWNGQYQVGKDCAKALFLREAPNARILHLSTHGILDSNFSYLAFTPIAGETTAEPLYLRDLYNLRLNAELVTLSACETGLGEFQRGEGVISLARAFAYAGAKSIVNSLWQVDNAATKDLMVAFYANLKTGKPKDVALREAKLEFIQKHLGEQQHPFFWAGLVCVGDMRPVQDL